MNCFKNYIGVRGCGADVPDSGIYINSLPGVTLQSIDAVASEEQVTFLNVFSDVEDRAITMLEAAIVSYLKKRYRLKKITQSINFGKRITAANFFAADTVWRGFKIDLGLQTNPAYANLESQMQHINIQSLSLYLQTAQGEYDIIPVSIFDLETGVELDSFDITGGVEGWNEIKVNKNYRSSGIACVYDASTVISTQLDLPQAASQSCYTCTQLIYGPQCKAMLKGIETFDIANPLEYTSGNNLFGLTAVFSIGCSFDGFVCDTKELFKNALLYAMGVELMIESLYTDRLNRYTTVDRDANVELKDHFQVQFEKELANALDGIDINTKNCCIECNAPIQIRESRM